MSNDKLLGKSRVQKGGNNGMPTNPKPKNARPAPPGKTRATPKVSGMSDFNVRDKVVLERMQFAIRRIIGNEMMENAKFSIEMVEDVVEGMALDIRAFVFAEKKIDKHIPVSFEYPATAWDYIKQKMNKKWSRCNLKVRYRSTTKTINLTAHLMYPEASIKLPASYGAAYIYEVFSLTNKGGG